MPPASVTRSSARGARGGRPERVVMPGRALGRDDVADSAQSGGAGADREDLGAAVDAGGERRRAFERLGDEHPARAES